MADYIWYKDQKKKVVFDPGHYNGANVDSKYPKYSEGTQMLNLGMMLRKEYGTPLTRTGSGDISFPTRVTRAKSHGAGYLLSIHTNYPTEGVIVFYSYFRPQDRVLAEMIGREVAKALGIKFRLATTRLNNQGFDYYGMIRQPFNQGMRPLIIEHGSHAQLANDTQNKLEKIVKAYGNILNKTIEGVDNMALRLGDKGKAVEQLQQDLIKLGYEFIGVNSKGVKVNYGADGSYGGVTERIVFQFQKENDLLVDGIAGPQVQTKLAELLAPKKMDKLAEAKKLAKKIMDL